MNILNPYRHAAAQTVYDFAGYDIQHLYTVFKTNLHNTNACFWIEEDGINNPKKVYFDEDGLISINSPCEDYDDLADYLTTHAGSNIYHKNIFEGTQVDNTINSIGGGNQTYHKIADGSGNILTKNSQPYFAFDGAGMFVSTPLSALDSGNDFSIAVVVSNHTSNSNGGVINTTNTAADRLLMMCDRRTNKLHTLVADPANNFADLTSQLNSSDSRVMITTMKGSTKTFKSYLGATLQNSATYTGSYTNDRFRVGANLSGLTPLTGTIQGILIADAEWDSSAVSDINTKLVNIFGL